jgi:hypothetical protein
MNKTAERIYKGAFILISVSGSLEIGSCHWRLAIAEAKPNDGACCLVGVMESKLYSMGSCLTACVRVTFVSSCFHSMSLTQVT